MRILMSIKPFFAAKIFNGSKGFEFRRTIFKEKGINTIVVYASFPLCKVIGEFEIEEIINDTPENIWNLTNSQAGITKEFFKAYFDKKEKGFAIKIKNVVSYSPTRLLIDYSVLHAPQSFCYLSSKVR